MAKLLDGRPVAAKIKQRHREAVKKLGRPPVLVAIQASSDPATSRYLKVKSRYAAEIGALVRVENCRDDGVVEAVERFNRDPQVDGVIIQLPLPDATVAAAAIEALAAAQDVDGLKSGSPFTAATALGIIWLLQAFEINPVGKTAAVIGQGAAGRPIADALEAAGAQVLRIDENSLNLAEALHAAEIIVGAAGQPGIIASQLVKPGAAVIDAGISLVDNKVAGDAAPELLERDDIAITPNPGGVGPMTVAALFDNLLRAAANRRA